MRCWLLPAGKDNKLNRERIILLILLFFVVLLIFPSINKVKFASGVDEGYYLYYSSTINVYGITAMRDLFSWYLSQSAHWLFPNPLRIVYILIASIWSLACGNSFISLAYLSFLAYLIFIITNYLFCAYLFNKKTALLFSFLIAFSPLSMAMARRALMDSLANLFTCASIWLFLLWFKKPKSVLKKLMFVGVFILAVLTKESLLLLGVPFFIFWLMNKYLFNKELFWSDILSIAGLVGAVVYVIYYFAAGDMGKALAIPLLVTSYVKSNSYALAYGSGPWFRYIIDYLLLSPWVMVLAVGYLFTYLISDKYDENISYLICFFLVSYSMFIFITKNVRYVMFLDMLIRLFAVFMLEKFTQRWHKINIPHACVVAVLLIAFMDYLCFGNFFIKQGIYDPMSAFLLKAEYIIP